VEVLRDRELAARAHGAVALLGAGSGLAVAVKWKRWGQWRAHLYEDERPVCRYPSAQFRTGTMVAAGSGKLVVLTGVDLSAHGVPWGPVCNRCLKAWNKRTKGSKS
jgi:hypothetical protein